MQTLPFQCERYPEKSPGQNGDLYFYVLFLLIGQSDAMKLIPFVAVTVLVLLATVPHESEAVPPAWFVAVAAKLGVKLVKNSYYARCNTRYAPPGVSCPSIVYGVGFSRNQAQNARFPLWRAPAGNHGRCIHQTMHET